MKPDSDQTAAISTIESEMIGRIRTKKELLCIFVEMGRKRFRRSENYADFVAGMPANRLHHDRRSRQRFLDAADAPVRLALTADHPSNRFVLIRRV